MARDSKRKAPGPRRWLFLGSLPELQRDPLRTFLRARETYGDVVKFRGGIWSAYLLCHPDDIRYVLQDNNQNFRKGFTYEYLKPLVGLGLLTNEGESWLSQRRLAQPAFHHERLTELAAVMTGEVERMLTRWRESRAVGPMDVAHEMAGLTMGIVSRALFASDLGADADSIYDAVTVGQEHMNWRITHLFSLPERYPTLRNLRFNRARKVLDTVVYSMIEQRRAAVQVATNPSAAEIEAAAASENRKLRQTRDEGGAGNDLLTLLLEARDEETGEGMTDWQLRDEVMTILLAGHETSADALAWTWWLLACNPEVEERLHAEVDSVLNGNLPQVGDLPRLQYTRMVLDEALRLRPPVWALVRFPLTDDVAGAYHLPAYSSVILSSYVTHRHPEFWDQPESFDPERFHPDLVTRRPRYAYFPFGGGPRMCLGIEFAIMEGVLALATIAREFRLRAVPGHRVNLEPLITLRPRGGLPMLLERRDRRSVAMSD